MERRFDYNQNSKIEVIDLGDAMLSVYFLTEAEKRYLGIEDKQMADVSKEECFKY